MTRDSERPPVPRLPRLRVLRCSACGAAIETTPGSASAYVPRYVECLACGHRAKLRDRRAKVAS